MGVLKTLTVNGETFQVTTITVAPSVTLLAAAWAGDGNTRSQVVSLPDATPYTKVDLQPTLEQLKVFRNKEISFTTENSGGVITVYAIGDKPTTDYTIQVTLTEVVGDGKTVIRGNTVGTPMPRSSFEQTDPTKADYIHGKEQLEVRLCAMEQDIESLEKGGNGETGVTAPAGQTAQLLITVLQNAQYRTDQSNNIEMLAQLLGVTVTPDEPEPGEPTVAGCLMSADGYILADINSVYLISKESV